MHPQYGTKQHKEGTQQRPAMVQWMVVGCDSRGSCAWAMKRPLVQGCVCDCV